MLNSCQRYHCSSSTTINSCQSDLGLLYLYRILSFSAWTWSSVSHPAWPAATLLCCQSISPTSFLLTHIRCPNPVLSLRWDPLSHPSQTITDRVRASHHYRHYGLCHLLSVPSTLSRLNAINLHTRHLYFSHCPAQPAAACSHSCSDWPVIWCRPLTLTDVKNDCMTLHSAPADHCKTAL